MDQRANIWMYTSSMCVYADYCGAIKTVKRKCFNRLLPSPYILSSKKGSAHGERKVVFIAAACFCAICPYTGAGMQCRCERNLNLFLGRDFKIQHVLVVL